MREGKAPNDAVTRNLLEAIERVRDDVAKVEFWAGAVAGFAEPVPEYEPDQGSVWLPSEQGGTLRSRLTESGRSQPRNDGTTKAKSPSQR
jgi:hypothetical protein